MKLVMSDSLRHPGACQAPLSMDFSWQGYWGGLPFPSPGDLHNPGIKPRFHALQANSLPSEPPRKPHFRDRWWAKRLLCTVVQTLKRLQTLDHLCPRGYTAGNWVQSCPTLCDSVDCSPPGSSIYGIFQARTLEWVVIPFSRGSS